MSSFLDGDKKQPADAGWVWGSARGSVVTNNK